MHTSSSSYTGGGAAGAPDCSKAGAAHPAPPPPLPPLTTPLPYTERQFDRSRSFSGLASSIELSALGAGGDADGCDENGTGAESDAATTSTSGWHRAPSAAAAAPSCEDDSWAAPFEVDEPSTETVFVMRSLREALNKKVRMSCVRVRL
jgi:hypothetical protein